MLLQVGRLCVKARDIIDKNNRAFGIYQRDEYANTLQQLMTYYGNIGDQNRQDECFNKLSAVNPHLCDDNDVLFVYKLSSIMRSDQPDDEKIGEHGRSR